MKLNFKIEAESENSHARAGSFHTLHGKIETPIFMPVGTQATVKSQSVETLLAAGSRVLLANTYHLMLRPGPEVFRRFGGIHRFMNWQGPVLTDSGGFQIFSLPHSRKINEEGAEFQSYVDGKKHLLSPEESIRMQKAIGSDIMMVLDQCIPATAGREEAEAALQLTHRWALRSLKERGESSNQALFAITQGACFHDLRKLSVEFLSEFPFDGFAIGGLAVGESREMREEFTEATASLLPKNLPRYLMGVGTPLDILEAVHRGVDLFDCILPSSLAQRGVAFTSRGKLQLRRGVYKFSEDPLDPSCACETCRNYSRSYLHHLIKCDEFLGWQLMASHNLNFYHQMMRDIRNSIIEQRFKEYYLSKREELGRSDEDNPVQSSRDSKAKTKSAKRLRGYRLGNYEIHFSSKPGVLEGPGAATRRQISSGDATLRQISSGEVMHSSNHPNREASLLYIEQSRLADRWNKTSEHITSGHSSDIPNTLAADTPVQVIWDVGLGAAFNAMATLRCFETREAELQGAEKFAPVRLISFEQDLDPLHLACKNSRFFPHLWHAAPQQFLKHGYWKNPNGNFSWELLKGNFLETFHSAPSPDLIFYDPFSLKYDSDLWTLSTFSGIYHLCRNRSTELYTYSASTAVRSALIAAGFFVGRGASTGLKLETTVAFTQSKSAQRLGIPLLGKEWLQRWHRSGAKFPSSILPEQYPAFEGSICGHPQFGEGPFFLFSKTDASLK